MGSYLPHTPATRREMLTALGLDDMSGLFADIPAPLRQKAEEAGAASPYRGMSEWETSRVMEAAAGRNRRYRTILRGAGAYRHIIPAAVRSITAKEGFVTAYTPYQPELSQGILQSIFEYQTYMCRLTGLDVSNASVYDGATAAAEALSMCRERRRNHVLVAATERAELRALLRTYCFASGDQYGEIPARDGLTDMDALKELLHDGLSCVYLPQLNGYGLLEDGKTAAALAHSVGARLILSVNPIAAALLPSAAEWEADIAVGEGQPLGLPLSYGGPYLGIMTCKAELLRRLPGRIVGQTEDTRGGRVFTLTLQAREQHIRREKAGSNICSNQAHCALTAAVYLSVMGASGLRQAATLCHDKAAYLACKLGDAGYPRLHRSMFFHEFVTHCPVEPHRLLERLAAQGILGPLPLPEGLLWCVTECVSREEMDEAVSIAAALAKTEGKS